MTTGKVVMIVITVNIVIALLYVVYELMAPAFSSGGRRDVMHHDIPAVEGTRVN